MRSTFTPPAVLTKVDAFLRAGGRLLVSPQGRFEDALDPTAIFPGEPDSDEIRIAAMRYLRIRDRHRHQLTRLVMTRGIEISGWRVLASDTSRRAGSE